MKPKSPVTRPIKIVFPDDPDFDRLVAGKAISSGDDKAWSAFIHTPVPVRTLKKADTGSKS